MRKLAVVVVAALAVVSCGGEEVSEEDVEIAQPSQSCRRAFESASTEESEDAARANSDERLDTATVGRLPGTLTECEGFGDWMAGARAFPDALPAQMDRTSVLRILCDSGDDDTVPCEELAKVGDQG